MAEVNVDSKLIRQQSREGDVETLELQNGCVCCSLAEDLLAGISKLVKLADAKNSRYDHIVVECSGIAEPRKIREVPTYVQIYMDSTKAHDVIYTVLAVSNCGGLW
jgi:G3E family GTPase